MFAEFADLYRALTIVGIPAPVADTMELWQIASAFGLARPDEGKRDTGRSPVPARPTADGRTFTPATDDSVARIERRLAEAALREVAAHA